MFREKDDLLKQYDNLQKQHETVHLANEDLNAALTNHSKLFNYSIEKNTLLDSNFSVL